MQVSKSGSFLDETPDAVVTYVEDGLKLFFMRLNFAVRYKLAIKHGSEVDVLSLQVVQDVRICTL